jgi:2-octaprenylphenol hydroxylase
MTVSNERSVAIAGAGPVGLAVAALLLADKGSDKWRIRILEPRPLPAWNPEQMDQRVYALSRASQRILDHLGVWSEIVAARASPYRRMHVWEGGDVDRLGSLSFDSAELGEPDLGNIVEDRLIRERLFGLFAASANVELHIGTKLAAVRTGTRAIEIDTEDGETFHASLLIAADGGNSAVRQLLDLPVRTVSYGQDAVVTHVETSRPHVETAWQRFLPDGPLAFLPLIDGRSSVVWSMNSEAAQRLSAAADCDFVEQLQAASGGVLGEISSSASRASFPLRALHAGRYCRPRVVLVGDAAHTVHPLAGQGMNLGLLDAAALADTLLEAVRDGQDPGDLRVLRRYERQRKGDNVKMLLGMDALHRLFRLPGPLFGSLRAAGLSAVDMAPPVKGKLMREALGLTGELPSAARSRVA